jgi:meiotically up-regulated gene 157 (Mug157) protein
MIVEEDHPPFQFEELRPNISESQINPLHTIIKTSQSQHKHVISGDIRAIRSERLHDLVLVEAWC